jgi:hypothetical protein
MTAVVKEEKIGVSHLHLRNKSEAVSCKSDVSSSRILLQVCYVYEVTK